MPTLYLIPTVLAPDTQDQVLSNPILETLKTTRIYFVENIKTTRRYISSLKLGIVIDDLTFYDLADYKDTTDLYNLLIGLSENIGLVSESGCPGVADPGSELIEIAHALGIRVKPLVGPNSIIMALMSSGLNGQSFAFNGYLPIDEKDREKKIKGLELLASQQKQTQLFIETPYRNKQMLASLLKTLKPETRLGIASNITAEDEFIKTGSVAWWRKQTSLPDIHKKPTIFMFL
jgi:16S rRNA (cytidine1402-2'-O)-methyltransferase